MAKLLDGTRIYGSANIDNSLIVNTMNIVPTITSSFLQANNANIYAFGAHQTANSAQIHANAAFLQANQVGGAVSTVNGALTAANTNMIFKTGNTMTGNLVMSGANIAFSTNSNSGIYWGGSGLSFIHSPNSNVIVFGTSNAEDMRLDPSGVLTVYNGITVAGTNIAPTLAFAYTHANGAFNQANNANIYAFGAHRTANSAQVHANAAFLQANNANIYAFGAHQTANSAQVHANAAFLQANQVGGAVSTANGALAAANTNMVFKTGNTMTGNLVMSGANIAFVTNSNAGIYWGGSGLSFIHSPNSNVIVFGTSNAEDMRLDPNGILTVYSGITVAGTNIAPTLTFAYTHANGAFLQANNANIYAFGAHQTANSAQIHANAAFLQANNANIYAFGAHQTANSAQVHANASFLQANQVGGAVSTANGALAAANTNMVFKTGNTMTGNLVMSGANIAFVTNSNAGIYWGGSGLSFIHSPNSNVIVFGTGNAEDMRLDPSGILTVYNGITVAGTNIAPTLAFAYTHANGAFDQANVARVHANAAFTKANLAAPIASPTFTGTVTVPSSLIVLKAGDPSEGGEIQFEKSSGSTISGNVIIDLYNDRFRIFEQTGTNRGFFLDITKGNTGVAGEILHTNNWFNFISTSGGGGGTSSNSVVYYSDSPPTGVANGTLWWQSNTGGLFIRYGDGDSTQWVATQQQGVGGSATFAQPANNSIVQNTTQLLATANGLSYTSSTFASAGDASINKYMLIGTTTNATPTRLLHSGGSGLIPVRSNTTIQYTVDIVARRTDVVGEGAGWTLKGVLDNFSGTVADVGNLYEIIVARDDTNYAVDALANNTSKSLDVMVTGVAAKQIRWVAYVQTIEVSQ